MKGSVEMWNKIRRAVIIFIIIILSFILQNTISVFSGGRIVTPNILIITTCMFGFMFGHKKGIIVGFIAGLLVDIYAADIVGMNSLIYMYVGFISGIFHRLFTKDSVILPISIVFFSDFLYNLAYYVFRFLLRNKLDFLYYFEKLILPEMVFTTFLAFVLYKLIYYVNTKWLAEEQRSTLNFD